MALTLPKLAPPAPESVAAQDVLFARHDPMLCGMPGLFRFVDDKQRQSTRTALRLTYQHSPTGLTIEAHNSVLLGGMELAVLQALTALAAVAGDTLEPARPLLDHEQSLVDALAAPAESASDAAQPVAGAVRRVDFAGSHLLEILGLSVCGTNRALVAQAVRHLATVVLLVYPTANPRKVERYHLLSAVKTSEQTDKWARTHVALNPRLTGIVLGAITQHTRIALTETRKLGTDQVARILHQRLCSWINDGRHKAVSYRTLLEYVWPNDAATAQDDLLRQTTDKAFARQTPARVQHDRLARVLAALNKLERTLPGWTVTAASQLPPPRHDDRRSDADNQAAQMAHDAYLAASARKAQADVLDTVVWIRRAALPKLSNRVSGVFVPVAP